MKNLIITLTALITILLSAFPASASDAPNSRLAHDVAYQTQTVSREEIIDAYITTFEIPWWFENNCSFLTLEETYNAVNEQRILDILEADKPNLNEFKKNAEGWGVDCDDYAFRLMGVFHQYPDTATMPIFVTCILRGGTPHALISYYTDGRIMFIEAKNYEVKVPRTLALLAIIG